MTLQMGVIEIIIRTFFGDPLEVSIIKYERLEQYVKTSRFFKYWLDHPGCFTFKPHIRGSHCPMCRSYEHCFQCPLDSTGLCWRYEKPWRRMYSTIQRLEHRDYINRDKEVKELIEAIKEMQEELKSLRSS